MTLCASLLCMPWSARPENPWGRVSGPGSGSAQAIGAYDLGCIRGAQVLPVSAAGYRAVRLFRHRNFGHPRLLSFVQTLGQRADREHWGTLLVGDLSQPRGGPPTSGHRSHQTGLDVDIWFQSLEDFEHSGWNEKDLDSHDPASVVAAARLHPVLWKARYGEVLAAAAQMPEVDRIFVNAAVKRALCAGSYPTRDWLSKLRPWWGHADHFHVRLKCPATDRDCVGQPSLPPGDGCDGSLDWWFSAAAEKPTPAPALAPRPLPAACKQLLSE